MKRKDPFDIVDGKLELTALKDLGTNPGRLYEAVSYLNLHVNGKWKEQDNKANQCQGNHQKLSRIAIASGTGAIIIAIVQLALKLTFHNYAVVAVWVEGFLVLASATSVVIGLYAKANVSWLLNRHRAERLRMIKFKALAHSDLWSGSHGGFKKWKSGIKTEMDEVKKCVSLDHMKDWSQAELVEPMHNSDCDFTAADSSCRQLVVYYRYKRLKYQSNYYKRKSDEAKRSWPVKLERYRARLFFIAIGFVILHFISDCLVGRMEYLQNAGLIHILELASVWGVVLAAVIPVACIGAHAWSAAFELSRKEKSFSAKHEALEKADDNLLADIRLSNPIELSSILYHIRMDEHYLEQEHREWLRLLIGAEWFL